ncbi:MAG TPA: hypothetical protein PLH53_01000 [Ignavibacteriaceae bacterium]|nr:hypothetical protein [Ignavibacterium sp.]HRP91439.1 hypothetical protein [Ignavibacteriaceae bacterium]
MMSLLATIVQKNILYMKHELFLIFMDLGIGQVLEIIFTEIWKFLLTA